MHPFYPQDNARDASDIFNGAPPNSQPQQRVNFQQQPLGNLQQQVNMEMLESLLAMQDASSQSNQQQHSPASVTPQSLLEHQLRLNQLQQLQQLQNQIFQQQLELLSGQSSFANMLPVVDRPRDTPQFGLPTPASSTELRAQSTTDFVSPMLLHSSGNIGQLVQNPAMLANFIPQIPQHMLPNTPHSAPANIVFESPAGYPLNDADLSELPPISSPMLNSYNNGSLPPSGSSSLLSNRLRSATTGIKRPNASSSGDEANVTSKPARKRPSHADRNTAAVASTSGTRKPSTRAVRSATSTPLFPATTPSLRPSPAQRGVHDAADIPIPGDTPSPVDPPMPPTHPPSDPPLSATFGPEMSPTPPLSATPSSPITGQQTHHITPVTPAVMFKLGRLAVESMKMSTEDGIAASKHDNKPATRSGTTAASSKGKAADKSTAGQHVSPGLKPIRPAGNAVMAPSTPSTPFMPPQIRKSSHKAAEQKRRDSLKTSFDDLRILLPPIPLPSEEGYPDEPILPGAMPPRGPPKGNAEGPNRGVSKLQLLRCGNEYIKVLKGRVDRRDKEIMQLRDEVRRLRELVGEEAAPDGQDLIDLERDLDACEISSSVSSRSIAGGMRASSVGEADMEEDGDF